jgi:formamidopyrimidine-DNA glycosylase
LPELPEVELVARSLERLITGKRIVGAKLLRPRLAPESSPQKFSRALRGRRIEAIGRRGKHILIKLDTALTLIVHLRMTGRFLYLKAEAPLPKHTHALFHLDDGRRLAFADQRHFGLMKIVPTTQLYEAKELRLLAPEPFSEEFTPDYLSRALARSGRTLKETLLDQKKVLGLGNIYAAEVLYRARINPFVTASALRMKRLSRLHRAIQDVLGESLTHGTTMNVDPENIDGSYYGGGYEGRWHVYDREGEPCLSCKSSIRRVSHAGRSTFFCPRCQRH